MPKVDNYLPYSPVVLPLTVCWDSHCALKIVASIMILEIQLAIIKSKKGLDLRSLQLYDLIIMSFIMMFSTFLQLYFEFLPKLALSPRARDGLTNHPDM
jgi:hypothetical protein